MIACAAPNPSIDRLFVTDAVTLGAIHRPRRTTVRAGGKGLNVARGVHALGAEVVAVALLAGHAGRWIADELAAEGVPARLAWAEGETRSCVSVAAGGRLTEFYERGDPPAPAAWTGFVAAVAGRRARWLSISGSLPPGVPAEEAGVLVRAGRAAGSHVAVDQHGPALAAALAAGPDLVKVNRHEAAELTGRRDPERAIADLREQAGAAVVTLGEEGALALTPDGALLRARLDVQAPYPAGSGDAFLAGLLVAFSGGAPWREALALALGAACANAETAGAGSFDPARARALATLAAVVVASPAGDVRCRR